MIGPTGRRARGAMAYRQLFEQPGREPEGIRLRGLLPALPERGPGHDCAPRDIVRQSWARARDYAVPPVLADARYVEVETDSPFARVARPVLSAAVERLTGVAVIGMLADANGLLLFHAGGDRTFERSAMESGPIVPGFDFSEAIIGTNGIGTALTLGHPVLIDSWEHFTVGGKSYSCGAAPVHGPGFGSIVGLVNFTCAAQDTSPLLLAMASTVAAQIERELMVTDLADLANTCRSSDPTALRALVVAERRRHVLRGRLNQAAIRAATTDVRCLLSQVMGAVTQLLPVEAVWVLRRQESGTLRVVATWGDVAAGTLGEPLPADIADSVLSSAHGRGTSAHAGRSWPLPGHRHPSGSWLAAAPAAGPTPQPDAVFGPGPPVQPTSTSALPPAPVRTATPGSPGAVPPLGGPAPSAATGSCLIVAALATRPDEATYDLLAEIATACDTAASFEEIRHQATSDCLTGLPNRRRFLELAQARLQQCRWNGQPFAVLMIDIDRFKQVNDTFGHATGDEVLATVAASIRATLRAGDIVGRIGGEEIAVITDYDPPDLAERLRQTIAALAFRTARGTLGVTVSVGTAQLAPVDTTLADVLDRADCALYAAKNSGRNRVVDAPHPASCANLPRAQASLSTGGSVR
ncbi:diguanylate cyclase [Frankia sp. Cpl3]|nr:diguanylate cyclase [Parafrankia colletiae]MCK9903022.1 diguanylate cyclase [Frankia sp. Cpl3]